MRLRVGTSGYSYKEWKGSFYPADLPAAKMLSFYAGRFDTVEINNTFYRMPAAGTLEKWASEVPDGFVFILKAPRWVPYIENGRRAFYDAARALGPKLGPLLLRFERKDVQKLREVLQSLPPDMRAAVEFRNDEWFDEETYAILRDHGAALCVAETDETKNPDALMVSTASWGYVRLRRTDYSRRRLTSWAERIQRQSWDEAFVFFKHEDEGKGPAFAREFMKALD